MLQMQIERETDLAIYGGQTEHRPHRFFALAKLQKKFLIEIYGRILHTGSI
jgi:hypothetical protein